MPARLAGGLVALLAASAGVVAAASPVATPPVKPKPRANPVQIENALPGTTAWQRRQANPGVMDAYTSEVSAAPGGQVHLHVSTSPAARYRIEIIRLGWYGGAGGRLVGCVPSCATGRQGAQQNVLRPSSTSGLLRLDWPVTDTVTVGRDWLSGYYYLDVVLTAGPNAGETRHVPLIVRAPPGTRSAILAQASVNTWQAYNSWGGLSLYSKFGTVEGSHVSFSRPYDLVHQSPASWELAAVHFLERRGYDVSYTTDVDTDHAPGSLLSHALVMVLGHDEYWTSTMRDAFERARDAGVNLAFMGANDGYWQIRYEDDRRTLVEYRSPDLDPEPDSTRKTTTFRSLSHPRPECELLGVGYGQVGDSADYVVNADALTDSWFGGTGFTPGSTLHGLVGYEWNGVEPGCNVPPLTDFFHYEALNGAPFREGANSNADAVRYTAASGARVFSGGSLQFAWGLDPLQERYDPRLDRFMRNGLDDLTRPPAPASASVVQRGAGVVVAAPPSQSVQVSGLVVYRHRGPRDFTPDQPGVVRIDAPRCTAFFDHPGRGVFRYAVAYASNWRPSTPVLAPTAAQAPRLSSSTPHANRCLRSMQ